MFRRLYFLLPSTRLAQGVVEELTEIGVSKNHIHTYTNNGLTLETLQAATNNQRKDRAQQLESYFWRGNLLLFFIALSLFIIALLSGNFQFAVICLGIMIISFAIGYFFTAHIPHIHLNQFEHAVNHREYLVMADMEDEKIGEVEDKIHRHHPAAFEGGSTWALKGVDI